MKICEFRIDGHWAYHDACRGLKKLAFCNKIQAFTIDSGGAKVIAW